MQNKTCKVVKFFVTVTFFLTTLSPANAQTEKFEQFINHFCSDSLFQISRIKFPLPYITWNYESDKEIKLFIALENYKFDQLFLYSDAYAIFYDNFECKLRDSGKMVFRWKGVTDMDRRYYFKRKKGLWFLVKILDYDEME